MQRETEKGMKITWSEEEGVESRENAEEVGMHSAGCAL